MEQKGNQNTPRIYVASLADYTCGRLLGKWIDATQGGDAIREEIRELLYHSTAHNAEEWAIHDCENFGGASLSESESIETVAELASLIKEHGELFGHLVEHLGGCCNLDEAKRYIEEGYHGAFDSIEDYVSDFVEECFGDVLKALPELIRGHLDYVAMANDMKLSGDIFTIALNGKVHVFSGNV